MSEFEDVKPYTQAELDQQAIWANEFNQWWENEGQYQRAGGGQYERTFAWWAWLNREQKQQAIIDDLRSQLNNMEACYIEKKKECEDQQKRIDAGLEKIRQFGKEGCLFPEWLTWAEKALRGAND
jgi:molecular chaperone GrpE (heat shock protein)